MSGIRKLTVPIVQLLLLVLVDAELCRAETIPDALRWYATIFVAEIEKADVEKGCPAQLRLTCAVDVEVQAIQILKDSTHQGLAPGGFRATIPRRPNAMMDPAGWALLAGQEIRAGQRYVLFSGQEKGLEALFQSPRYVMRNTDKDDPVADIQLMLASAALPLRQQADSAAAALSGSGKPRSIFFADYVATLLVTGTETDNAALVQVLEHIPQSVFSDWAKGGLLGELWSQVRGGRASLSRLHLFVALTARYLISAPDESDSSEPGITARGIVGGYIPWILGSESAMAVLRNGLEPALREEFRARTLKILANGRFPSQQRADLRKLMDRMSAQ